MKKFFSALLALLMILGCAAASAGNISVGEFTLATDPSWRIDMSDSYQLYVYDETGYMACNLQYYDYAGFSQSHDELIGSGLENDYGIAEMIISSIDTTGDMFATMEKEYISYSGGFSAVRYYGKLSGEYGSGFYSGTLIVNSSCILSTLTLNHRGDSDLAKVRSFDDSVVSNLQYSGSFLQQQDGAELPDITIDISGDGPDAGHTAETVELSCISFVTPDGWQLEYSNSMQACYLVNGVSVCLNAYAPGALYPGMGSMESYELAGLLTSTVDAAMVQTGIDTSVFDYTPFELSNGDTAIFFHGYAGPAMNNTYLTSAIFCNQNGMTGLITILNPADDPEFSQALLTQSVNMYYTRPVLSVAGLPTSPEAAAMAGLYNIADMVLTGEPVNSETQIGPSETTAAAASVTGADSPVASVVSTDGTSISDEENNALSAAIAYASTGDYTHAEIIELLVADGYGYDAAVFAADNCGLD